MDVRRYKTSNKELCLVHLIVTFSFIAWLTSQPPWEPLWQESWRGQFLSSVSPHCSYCRRTSAGCPCRSPRWRRAAGCTCWSWSPRPPLGRGSGRCRAPGDSGGQWAPPGCTTVRCSRTVAAMFPMWRPLEAVQETYLGVVVVPVPGIVPVPAEDVPVVWQHGTALLGGVGWHLWLLQAERRGQALVGPKLRQVGQLSVLTRAGR